MCCKLLAVEELAKPPQAWCGHCAISVGCTIYGTRPADCRTFYCGWLLDPSITDDWRPNASRMVVKFEPNRIVIHVDKDRRDTWKREPFHAQIQRWAQAAAARGGEVIVYSGKEAQSVAPPRTPGPPPRG